MKINIRTMTPDDWQQVKKIYEEGIQTEKATFQTTAPSWKEWSNTHILACSLVAEENNTILGWASISPVSSRCVYTGVGEVSIYVKENSRGKGIGDLLLINLIDISEQNEFWTLQSAIFPENHSSIKLHIKHDFREVGRREKVGKLHGKWRDVLLLERRSRKVGL